MDEQPLSSPLKQTVMENIKLLFLTCLALLSTCTFAGTTIETSKPEFQFTALEAVQTSWEHALLRYNINDMSTGEVLDIPTFLLNYEVKDNEGKMVSNGSGLYISIADMKLASQEDYTIEVSAMINGEKVSRSVCKKASPKKLQINLNSPNHKSNNETMSYNATRPKYSEPAIAENIKIEGTCNTANYEEVTVCSGPTCETYKINAYDKTSLQTLQKALQQLAKTGKGSEEPMASTKSNTTKANADKINTTTVTTATATAE